MLGKHAPAKKSDITAQKNALVAHLHIFDALTNFDHFPDAVPPQHVRRWGVYRIRVSPLCHHPVGRIQARVVDLHQHFTFVRDRIRHVSQGQMIYPCMSIPEPSFHNCFSSRLFV
ncbi:hypothetical protein A5756_19625 [Mycobacterium sp. 852002-53434_SCH5985345]|nr:hypothetical protein A5756_19625 [Mycobacterium sp. 852002-53434_SCH5985345]OBF72559.1 hypothetical protein A5750_16710 [Mycobacterium sp. 852002-51613_SCH5001154]OBF93578.1 hypothetical protein A5773_19400 [Mycobacterium sp. 852014-52450_SCH5900713]